MYDVGVPARGVVPVDVPYAVLAQFLSSGQRPDTVEWELGERMPAILSDEGWELRN
ncbi:Imm1 family immunity protein [Actinokineospora diospyrosa]|uniref:Imm1 family immunity protein n=1 Tax=Actinokineospora diospyrosa TaxID=103728 RepID=UPI00355917A8